MYYYIGVPVLWYSWRLTHVLHVQVGYYPLLFNVLLYWSPCALVLLETHPCTPCSGRILSFTVCLMYYYIGVPVLWYSRRLTHVLHVQVGYSPLHYYIQVPVLCYCRKLA